MLIPPFQRASTCANTRSAFPVAHPLGLAPPSLVASSNSVDQTRRPLLHLLALHIAVILHTARFRPPSVDRLVVERGLPGLLRADKLRLDTRGCQRPSRPQKRSTMDRGAQRKHRPDWASFDGEYD
ncbi:predicted protein [Plenodomus lingam JN3]|uniref:Predicted protein n=1 Tax=Leptosphaeria maculans (strain JN3 / isolate v23.1.3 / race Av1-4-5-6-7-8) TaxID=985895 RepID=E5A5C5_LEPMJ|nr:predicted protein [Plenodomus lingam JN3]CBX98823.1 predicted protein [Plenodomus lingam JN3]